MIAVDELHVQRTRDIWDVMQGPKRTSVELLRFPPQSRRTTAIFSALMAAAHASGFDVTDTQSYRGSADLLLLWGGGAPNRFEAIRRQVAAGGHVVCCDLPYWDRYGKFRVSIDGPHPPQWVMRRDWPRDRFVADHVPVSNAWDPNGPIIVAGLGLKARVQYGSAMIDDWERSMMRACAVRFGRPVRYRRKKPEVPVPAGAVLTSDALIDTVLTGASLLVTWHSNVAVDAVRLGIPVICRDGAAAAVCPSDLTAEDPRPLPVAVRDQFLANLAYFQWRPDEARQCWAFLLEILS